MPAGTPRQPLGRAQRGTAGEVFGHRGFDDCKTAHMRRWAHIAIFYGFLGLVAATTGAFIYTEVFPRLGVAWQNNQLSLPLWDPVKIVGNVGGVALLVALVHTMWVRRTRPATSGKSVYSDWFFSGLLGLTVELWNPGSILPGVAGGLCLLLAFLALAVLRGPLRREQARYVQASRDARRRVARTRSVPRHRRLRKRHARRSWKSRGASLSRRLRSLCSRPHGSPLAVRLRLTDSATSQQLVAALAQESESERDFRRAASAAAARHAGRLQLGAAKPERVSNN